MHPYRYRRSRQPAAVGSILGSRLNFPPTSKTPYQRGREAERKVLAQLRREGYSGTLTPFSHGVFDIEVSATPRVGEGMPIVRRVQVKHHQADRFIPSCLNEAVRTVLRRTRVVEGVSREVWCWVWGKGAVVKVAIDYQGVVALTGKGEYPAAVGDALIRAGLM